MEASLDLRRGVSTPSEVALIPAPDLRVSFDDDLLVSPFVSRTATRAVFLAAGVPHAPGVHEVRTVDDVAAAVRFLRTAGHAARAFAVTLDDDPRAHAIATLVPPVDLDGGDVPFLLETSGEYNDAHGFLRRLAEAGGVVEVHVDGPHVTRTAVLLSVPTAAAAVPAPRDAEPENADELHGHSRAVVDELARRGVVGTVTVGFAVVRLGHATRTYATHITPEVSG